MTPDHLTAKDMDGLDLNQLRSLLNKQIAQQRRLQDKLSESRAQLGVTNTNIQNIRNRIDRFSPSEAPIRISDHAILRYLQRVCGIDLGGVRDVLDTPELRECIRRCPTGRHTINGITYVTQDAALVTVIYEDEPRPDAPLPVVGGGL